MSKTSRESQLEVGESLLREWGIGAETDVEALQKLAGREAAADLAIAARLGGLVQPASVEVLRAIESRSKDKLVQKEIKRALYRLEQRGAATSEAAPLPTKAFTLAPALEGFFSALDGRGDQLVWILKPRPGGLLHLFAVINDPQGLREIEIADTTRKGLKSIRDQMMQRHEIRMVEVDWRYCDFLIDRAFQWSAEKQLPVRGDYRALRAQITNDAVAPMQPPIFRHLDAPAVRAETSLISGSEQLLNEPEMRTWFFAPEDLAKYLKELQDTKDSPLVLSQAQQQERFGKVIERAVAEIFGGDLQASWVRRLQDMALFFHNTNRPQAAKHALAAALALESNPHGGREIGFFEVLIRSCLAAYWKAEEQREAEAAPGSLVLTPAQAAREAQRRR